MWQISQEKDKSILLEEWLGSVHAIMCLVDRELYVHCGRRAWET